jgi:hypothetical protein
LLPLCSLESASSGLDLSISSSGYLTVRDNFAVDALNTSVTVSGSLDVFGSVHVGSLNLPREPAELTLSGSGFLSSSRFDITPNSSLAVSALTVVQLAGPRTVEQAGITCVACNQQFTPPQCIVRNPQCIDAFGLAPVEQSAGQYWANCLSCACVGGPDACTTQRTPFVYGKAWCFIDSPSRQSGCVGSDGVSSCFASCALAAAAANPITLQTYARFELAAQPWATCTPPCKCAENSFCGESHVNGTSLCRVLNVDCQQDNGLPPYLIGGTNWTACTPCQCKGGTNYGAQCALHDYSDQFPWVTHL